MAWRVEKEGGQAFIWAVLASWVFRRCTFGRSWDSFLCWKALPFFSPVSIEKSLLQSVSSAWQLHGLLLLAACCSYIVCGGGGVGGAGKCLIYTRFKKKSWGCSQSLSTISKVLCPSSSSWVLPFPGEMGMTSFLYLHSKYESIERNSIRQMTSIKDTDDICHYKHLLYPWATGCSLPRAPHALVPHLWIYISELPPTQSSLGSLQVSSGVIALGVFLLFFYGSQCWFYWGEGNNPSHSFLKLCLTYFLLVTTLLALPFLHFH